MYSLIHQHTCVMQLPSSMRVVMRWHKHIGVHGYRQSIISNYRIFKAQG
ncbi:MAG TPA: hypothetical protein PLV25_07590 [Opitutales bacterium]|nr:hypothetical protein [Opitutales bacterium]